MKRKYRSGLAPVLFREFTAAVTQGASLARSAERLLNEGDHALALSVAVLALEEIGKALLIDGLIFAKAGDEKGSGIRARTPHAHREIAICPGLAYVY